MYKSHFGLVDIPFSIAPNPEYLFMSKRHRDALAHLLYGVQTDGGFILLTGEVGTGKTTLCRCLLQQVPQDVETAFVLNPRVTTNELLATICDEFSIPYDNPDSAKLLVDQINEHLLGFHASGKRAVLIIDEAQNLSRDVLEQLRLLTNLETNERKLLQIILLGQPELLEILADPSLRQLNQRITARFHLEALELSDTQEYIRHRLSIAGTSADIFTSSAVKKVYRISDGIPRIINLVCDRAMLGAYASGEHRITPKIIEQAANEVLGASPKTNEKWPLGFVAALLLTGVVSYALVTTLPDASAPEIVAEPPVKDTPPLEESKPAPPDVYVVGHDDIHRAYHDLFALWGTAFEDQAAAPCQLAENIGLSCHDQLLEIHELIDLNRPVIVYLDGTFLTLSEITPDNASLIAGAQQYDLTFDQFARKFDGRAYILWRTPPAYSDPIKVHDRGAAVDWLVIQLSILQGKEPPLDAGFSYTVAMEDQVKAFQRSVGLDPTGIVDTMTWMHINNIEAINIPQLNQSEHRG